MRGHRFSAVVFAACLAMMAWYGSASAHKVNLFAYVENGKIFVESYFPDGKAVERGGIEILDSQGQKVGEGVTDKEGKCVLPIPKKDDLTIVINASMGHKNMFLLKKSELGE